MADNFLERHQLDYERRKAEWLRKKGHLPLSKRRPTPPHDD
ncbi:dehydrogenase [Hoylesella enoeca]|nr:dehydrogenase [Hoylesella enoeca]